MNEELPAVFGRKFFLYRRPQVKEPDKSRVGMRVVNVASLTVLQWLQLLRLVIEHEFNTEGFTLTLAGEPYYLYWNEPDPQAAE